jgi:uncharacterized membrane protein
MSFPGRSMIRREASLGITAGIAIAACTAAAANAPVAVMAVLGILLFAAPGYLLDQILFGSRAWGLERVAAATGLALCVPILGGLLLYAARVPLHRSAWIGLLATVTLACDLVLLSRHIWRRRAGTASSDEQRIRWRLPAWQVAAFGAALVIAASAVGLASVGAVRQPYPGFAQLWLVHRTPNAPVANLGVTNNEGRTVRYKLVLFYDTRVAKTWALDLSNGQTWRQATKFTSRYTITAKLYRLPEISRAYRYVVIAGPKNETRPRNRTHGRSARRH